MEVGKWKMAQTWSHFKRPASSKGMWKQFVEESKERDQMAEGGVPQLVQPGPGRQGYQGFDHNKARNLRIKEAQEKGLVWDEKLKKARLNYLIKYCNIDKKDAKFILQSLKN